VCRPNPLANLVAQHLNGKARFVAIDFGAMNKQAWRLVNDDQVLIPVENGQ
jgi:hypothetical protein